MFRRVLKVVNTATLTDAQKKEIKKIMADRKRLFDEETRLINALLGKKPKAKK